MKVQLVPMDSIREMKDNPRKITKEELKALRRSLRKFGMPQQLVVYRNSGNKHDGEIIGGHQRWRAAKTMLKFPSARWGRMRTFLERGVIPVTYWKGPYAKARALNIALNKVSGDFDVDKLGSFLSSIGDEDLIRATGFTDEELSALTEQLGKYTPTLAPGEVGDVDLSDVGVTAKPIKPRETKQAQCPKCHHRFIPK